MQKISMFLPSCSGVQPEVGTNPYGALGSPNAMTLLPGVIPATLRGNRPRQKLATGGCKLPSGYRLTKKDASRDPTMVVGGISGSIDHRHLWVRDAERFSHVPA